MFKRHVIDQLSSYIDNQLSDRRKKHIQEHLKGCSVCADELKKLQLVSEKLKELHAPDLHEGFESFVINEIVQRELEREGVKMKSKGLRILIPSTAVAGLLVVWFVGHLFITMGLQPYLKRGISGRLRDGSDQIGDQFSPEFTKYKYAKVQEHEQRYSKREPESSFNEKVFSGEASLPSSSAGLFARKEPDYISQSYKESGSETTRPIQNEYTSRTGSVEYTARTGSIVYSPKPEIITEGPLIVVRPILPTTAEGEMVIRTGQIKLEVEDGRETYQNVSGICKELGGYVATSKFYKDGDGREYGVITMRIPKDKFDVALERLGALGKLEGVDTNSQDVTQEYNNLKSRLDTAKIAYDKMLEALAKRNITVDKALELESELNPIRNRIEELKGQIEYLNNVVSFTTITLEFREPQVSTKLLKDSKQIIKESMINASIGAIKFVSKAVPVLIIVGLWAVAVIVVFKIIRHWLTKLFKRN